MATVGFKGLTILY